jgi:hypothetical protein
MVWQHAQGAQKPPAGLLGMINEVGAVWSRTVLRSVADAEIVPRRGMRWIYDQLLNASWAALGRRIVPHGFDASFEEMRER